jgi:arylsulfatase A-like enzyme
LTKAAAAAGGRKLNVLMVVLDDMRPDLVMWGHADAPATPRFDAFSNQARVFRRAYSQFPDCAPSRQSFLTGLRPDNLGITSHDCTAKVHEGVECDFRKSRPGTVSMPEFFRKAGYVALSYGKVFHQGLDDALSWSPQEEWPDGFVRGSAADTSVTRGWEYEQWLSPAHAVCGAEARAFWRPNSASNLTHPVQPFAAAGCFTEEHDGATTGSLNLYTDHRTASRAAFALRLLGARPDHRPPTTAGLEAANEAAEATPPTQANSTGTDAVDDAAAAAADAAAGDRAAEAFAATYGPSNYPEVAKQRPAPWFLAVGFVRPHLPMVCFQS